MRGPESCRHSKDMNENTSSSAAVPGTTYPTSHTSTPQPILESEARTWSTLVHVLAIAAMLVSGGTLAFVAPLVIWLLYKDRSALVAHHGKQNLNLQITLIITGAIAVVGGLLALGVGLIVTLPLWGMYALYGFIVMIVAAVRANRGEYYTIPLTLRVFK